MDAVRTTPRERLLVAVFLGLYLLALGWQAWRVGLTVDEPAHMLDAYLYWLDKPDLFPIDLPPLIKILTGWIPRALEIPLFPEVESWKIGIKANVASDILDRLSPARIQELVYLMRLVLTIFPLLTALLVWRWGRLLFGRGAALLLLAAAVLEPTALAHGCLVKSDLASAFTYLLFAFCGWRFWIEPGARRSLLLGGSVLLAILAKMSLLVVWPLGVLLVMARVVRGPRPLGRWLPAAVASVTLVPYAGWIAAYKFDMRRLTDEDFREMRGRRQFPEPMLRAASVFRWIPTPADAQRGARSLRSNELDLPTSYMLGGILTERHLGYYPLALALKTPIALQILFAGGVILLVRRRLAGRGSAAEAFLLAAGPVYLAVAMRSNLQLGVRLVMPVFPFLLLIGGYAIERGLASRRGRAALAAAFAWLLAASLSIYPQGIAYFNEWAGGPKEGSRYLVDSNLDWGQDLPRLAEYVRRNRLRDLKLFYFGFDKLHRYGLDDSIRLPPPWSPDLVREMVWTPQPGLYAVSATLLPGHFFALPYRDYFRYFRRRAPDDRVGHSILIYRVPQNESASAPKPRAHGLCYAIAAINTLLRSSPALESRKGDLRLSAGSVPCRETSSYREPLLPQVVAHDEPLGGPLANREPDVGRQRYLRVVGDGGAVAQPLQRFAREEAQPGSGHAQPVALQPHLEALRAAHRRRRYYQYAEAMDAPARRIAHQKFRPIMKIGSMRPLFTGKATDPKKPGIITRAGPLSWRKPNPTACFVTARWPRSQTAPAS